MLNIISRSIVSNHTRGPRKVVLNLIKGLDEIGYPYVLNAALDATNYLWIHDDKDALIKAMKLSENISIIAGPNIYTLPNELPNNLDNSRIILIHPALWVQEFWNISSTRNLPSVVWPVGIDTTNFSPVKSSEKDLIIVYNKQRSEEDTKIICEALSARGEKYEVINYGNYLELDYQKLLTRAKGIVWVGRSESQGIGLLEALAMNVPALVWDINCFGEWSGGGKEIFSAEQLSFTRATAIPYFDNTCGISFSKVSELEASLSQFLSRLSSFQPRKFIIDNLSLSKQAKAFLDIFKINYQVTEASLLDTTLNNKNIWKNASWHFKVKTRFKDVIRQIIR